MTVSYIVGLNELSLSVLSSNPILRKEGLIIGAEPNLRRMVEAAPALRPYDPTDWSRFPGGDSVILVRAASHFPDWRMLRFC